MRTLYFDCFAGASGDMLLGALVSAGVSADELRQQLSRLPVSNYELSFQTVDRSGISATHAVVKTESEHVHRHLRDILGIIHRAELPERVTAMATEIFARLAQAEARVHNQTIDEVHFHEVGAVDAIVDVVGAAIGFEVLGIERFACSAIHVGSGTVDMEHGRFPVPPPAVAELLKDVPIYSTEVKGELITPTGAAIITTVCSEFGTLPLMKVGKVGYGAGTRTYEKFPNALRILVGDDAEPASQDEQLWLLETNIDDLSPQYFGYVMDRAFSLGALDAFCTPVQMKKGRPGVLLTVLCREDRREDLLQMLFAETTTLGVRSSSVMRRALPRSTVQVETPYGLIDVKVARLENGEVKEMPEYDQCRKAAERAGVPLRVVQDAVQRALRSKS